MPEDKKADLEYKGHPLRRKDNMIYFGSMAEKYIILLQILDTRKVKDLDVATKVSVQLQLTDVSPETMALFFGDRWEEQVNWMKAGGNRPRLPRPL